MKIKDIFPSLPLNKEIKELNIKGICDDSRLLKRGELFFIRAHKNFDIFSVLKDAQIKTAAFVADSKDKGILKPRMKKPIIFLKDSESQYYKIIDRFYGFGKNDFLFIGITGTNGKTTTAHLIYYLLKKLGQNVSLIGTVKYYLGNHSYRANYTTPDYLTLRKNLAKIKGREKKIVVMEASSHGLAQERLKGIDFSYCVFTNLTRDHLDYHKTVKKYFAAKKKLFMQNPKAKPFINIDDVYGKKLSKTLKGAVTYGLSRFANIRAANLIFKHCGTEFDLLLGAKKIRVKTLLLGKHNVLNILGALGVVFSLGFKPARVVKLIPGFRSVDGRLEEISRDIYVDYAHTPDALKKVLGTLKEIGYKKIICVFGCGGDRDKGKRKLMGEIASAYADFSFVTSDNPRSENPVKICRQVAKGFAKRNYVMIVDRKKAIKNAIKLKNRYANCCLIVAGKGHEDCQIIANKRIPFKDKKVIKKYLGNKDAKINFFGTVFKNKKFRCSHPSHC